MYFREGSFFERKNDAKKYSLEQLRSEITYNFRNGDNITFDMRLPLKRDAYYKTTGTKEKKAEVCVNLNYSF